MLTYRNTGARPLAPVSGAARCCDVVMEPASLAAPPAAAHRSRRRRAAGPRPPTRPRGSVPRSRLVRRLREAREAPFVLLVAPAGYGKTTLLSEWAACDGRRFAWIDLGAGDHDPDRLVASVKRTVHDTEPPTVLVVDNAHLVSTPETFDALDDVARSMPSGSQLALASRCEPGLPVGSLRAHRRVFELRTGDLAMTRSEASALLTAAGIRLASDGLDRLMDRTEGWPAGLYLAALSLRAQPSVDAALSRFAGDDQVVADYLRDELMARLEPDHVDFLLRTSILDTLSGPLCDAVLGEGGSGRILATLARSNVLLVSLDRGGTSYRYHPLFREMLHSELRRLDPGREPELHARASAWHEEHGDLDSAIHHAVAAGNPEHSGELLWRHASSYIGHGRNDALAGWLNHFNDDQLAAVPSLAVAAASSRLAAGDGEQASHWASAAARELARRSSSKRGALDGAVRAPTGVAGGARPRAHGPGCRARLRARLGARRIAIVLAPARAACPINWPVTAHEHAPRWTTAHARALWRPRTSRRCVSPSSHCSKSTATIGTPPPSWLSERAHVWRGVGWRNTRSSRWSTRCPPSRAPTAGRSRMPIGTCARRAGWSTSSWTSFRGTRPRRASRSRARRSA